jgi:hypothetical protein
MDTQHLPMSQASGLVKQPLIGARRIVAAKLKPPGQEVVGGQVQCYIRYVTTAGREVRAWCTPRVFARVLGTRSTRRAHTGLDLQCYSSFILSQNPSNGLIEAIDVYPNRPVLHNLERADAPGHRHVVVEVIPDTGECSVVEYPDGVTEAHMQFLLNDLADTGILNVGDSFHGFEIRSVAGNRVYFNTDHMVDLNQLQDEDSIFKAAVGDNQPATSGNAGRTAPGTMGGIGFTTPQGGGDAGEVFMAGSGT